MHPPSEPPPADRAAAHSVTAPEPGLDGDAPSRLSSSPAGTHDWSRSSTQPLIPIAMRVQTRSNASPEPASASDSDSGSDAFYGLHTEVDAPTSPTAPLAPFPPLPPPAARSRAPEFYGFVAATGTYLVFALYLLWAFLPDAAILVLGVSWYPNREWSLLIPAYGMVLVLLTYFTYFALALAGTPPLADMRTITDSKAHLPASPSDADAAPDVDFNGDGHGHGHGGDTNSNAGSDSVIALASNIHPADAPPTPEPRSSSRSGNGAHARTQSLLALTSTSTPPPPQNSIRRPQPHLKPEPEFNASTPKSKPTPKASNPYLAHARPDAIPELYDIPLGMVNRVVYGPRRARTRPRTQP
ncbi:hypothetical protein GSI_14579 [Ganoderma sinense ZZ0214-1]|uniref:PIG-P domain-containing protein n=1 Tax=Ganoderma sinense ZZ0214-1 TaxID=1077348 RepID=A0A2G8RP32_9APHY|nr:hypothetical protein GSI_14579 [Ganoderma sinense ZZ0214-1]